MRSHVPVLLDATGSHRANHLIVRELVIDLAVAAHGRHPIAPFRCNRDCMGSRSENMTPVNQADQP